MNFRPAISVLIFFTFLSVEAFCQNAAKMQGAATGDASPDNNINLRVYHQSIGLGDYSTAIHAVHYLIAGDPAKYDTWADTLALLYAESGAYRQSYILSDELLSKGYTELRMGVKAVSAKNLQQNVEAIDAYTTLYNKTNNPGYGFELLQLQYGIRRLAETIATGNKMLLAMPANDSSRVNVAKLDGKTAQQVSLKSAIENIMGLAYIDLKDKDNAVASFSGALKENPDFDQAKNNLSVANSLASDTKK